jgi:hypothetical protein
MLRCNANVVYKTGDMRDVFMTLVG